nr:hypothetical protein [Micromonospora craniellae]
MPPTPIRRADPGSRPVRRTRRCRTRLPAVVGLAVLLLAGCGEPPDPRDGSALPTLPPTAAPTGSATPTPPPFGEPPSAVPTGAPTDAGLVAVACTGQPSRQRIVDLVRGRDGLLPRNARVQVASGPVCAAGWHFTSIDVTGYEPLQVVTRDQAGTLRLVTAGTDVCSVEVRVASPVGIRTLACGDEGSVPAPVPPVPSPPPVATPTPSGQSLTPSASTSSPGA